MSHPFEPDGYGFCRECGMDPKQHRDFGEPRFDYDVPQPDPVCRGCWHVRHDSEPCPMRRSPARPGACGCTAGVAA